VSLIIILIGLPFAVAGLIKISNPTFLDPLATEPMGRLMLMSTGIMMLMGIFVILRMVKIEV